MEPNREHLAKTLKHVDQLLHSGDFVGLEKFSGGTRLSAAQIKFAIEDYPEALAPRPNYELEDGAIVAIRDSIPPSWSVYLHLWRRGGGRSDLTAELTLIDTGQDLYGVEIDNIYVL